MATCVCSRRCPSRACFCWAVRFSTPLRTLRKDISRLLESRLAWGCPREGCPWELSVMMVDGLVDQVAKMSEPGVWLDAESGGRS